MDLLEKTFEGFHVYEIKSTQTVTPALFKGLDYFASLAESSPVKKTLIYGGNEGQKRTTYSVMSWRNLK